jgi:pantetheine-phosphate adenylyltransferase
LTIVIYPGTFDPITNGHLDVATRAARIFDTVIMGVYDKPSKHLVFTTEERVELARQATAGLPNVEVRSYTGLTVDFARQVRARGIVRGLRMSSDFDREFDMAIMNKRLSPAIEVVCLMADIKYQFLSSSLLKEASSLGGNVGDLVPEPVAQALREKFKTMS